MRIRRRSGGTFFASNSPEYSRKRRKKKKRAYTLLRNVKATAPANFVAVIVLINPKRLGSCSVSCVSPKLEHQLRCRKKNSCSVWEKGTKNVILLGTATFEKKYQKFSQRAANRKEQEQKKKKKKKNPRAAQSGFVLGHAKLSPLDLFFATTKPIQHKVMILQGGISQSAARFFAILGGLSLKYDSGSSHWRFDKLVLAMFSPVEPLTSQPESFKSVAQLNCGTLFHLFAFGWYALHCTCCQCGSTEFGQTIDSGKFAGLSKHLSPHLLFQ